MFYQPFDRSMGLWVINEVLKLIENMNCWMQLFSETKEHVGNLHWHLNKVLYFVYLIFIWLKEFTVARLMFLFHSDEMSYMHVLFLFVCLAPSQTSIG